MSKIIIERFKKVVCLHVIRTIKSQVKCPPLILGINGPPGEGKTFQCKAVLKEMNVMIYEISVSQFEDAWAGVPVKSIRDIYNQAIEYVLSKDGNMAALVIDDIDVAIGKWGDLYQYTVNTQMVIGELMHLADTNEAHNVRIPIFFTGNDLSKLYSPLTRDGRMDFFYWKPKIMEKAKIISQYFTFLNITECKNFIVYVNLICKEKGLVEAPVSFYSSLASHLYDEEIWEKYKNSGSIFFGALTSRQFTLEELKSIAKERLTQIKFGRKKHIM